LFVGNVLLILRFERGSVASNNAMPIVAVEYNLLRIQFPVKTASDLRIAMAIQTQNCEVHNGVVPRIFIELV
jgi:hypothetical protein